jgi:hypothetical protein
MSFVPDHVEHPSAWLDARDRRIKANANKTRRRKLDAELANDTPEFRAWLLDIDTAEIAALDDDVRRAREDAGGEYDAPEVERLDQRRRDAIIAWRKRVGYVPEALRLAMQDWGGLSEKQLAWARSAFVKNIERSENRDAAENARRASAPSWTPGRQTITGVIQFARGESFAVGPRGYHSAFSMKGILLLDDGRKCWTSIPRALYEIHGDGSHERELKGQRITITATFSPSDDDPTMAFAKRPTLTVDATNDANLPESPVIERSGVETPADAKRRRARERRALRNQRKLDAPPEGV